MPECLAVSGRNAVAPSISRFRGFLAVAGFVETAFRFR